MIAVLTCLGATGSLSARRAWIEIQNNAFKPEPQYDVALRKESVDRNAAWTGALRDMHHVALRKESVDRNAAWTGVLRDMHRRSPQGERG